MNRIVSLLASVVMIAFVCGCADDIVLEEDAALEGTYEGTYTLTENYGSPQQSSIWNNVLFTFTDKNYVMEIDAENNTEESFCRVDGLYSLAEGVRLQEQHSQPDGNAGFTACDPGRNPEGTFVRDKPGDTLVLQLQDGTTLKTLRLTRTVEEPDE